MMNECTIMFSHYIT